MCVLSRIIVLLGLFELCWSVDDDRDTSNREKLVYLLLDKYEKKYAPNSIGKAKVTTVYCDLYVNSFDSISESDMDFTVNLVLFVQWNDSRLKWKLTLNDSFYDIDSNTIERIWRPDLYFPNEKSGQFHKITIANQMMRLYKNGDILYATRLSLTLTCPMDLRKYPLDEQHCAVRIQSFAYSESQLHLEWGNGVDVPYNKAITLPQFEVDSHTYSKANSCISEAVHVKTGNRSCLEVEFKLVRNLGYYLVQIYVPSVLIVMLSWLSFWLNVESVPARISLGVLTVLTMTTQTSATGSSMPRVSYTKAIDIWMVACLVFVFAALIEFSVANVFARKDRPRGRSSKRYLEDMGDVESLPFKQSIARDQKGTTLIEVASQSSKAKKDHNGQHYARRLDVASRVLFPMAFGVFNLSYWVLYKYVL